MSNKLVEALNQYQYKFTLKGTGKVITYNPITTGQMKGLLVYEGNEEIDTLDRILDDVINGCVTTEDFNLDELNLQDRFDLLMDIRKKSKGDQYTFTIKCPVCKTESIINVNLSSLEDLPYNKPTEHKVKLNDGLFVFLDYITVIDQKNSYQLAKTLKLSNKMMAIEALTYSYAFAMKRFEDGDGNDLGEFTVNEKRELLDTLDDKSYIAVNKWFSDNNYGIVFKYDIVCSNTKCNEKKRISIPVSSFFD